MQVDGNFTKEMQTSESKENQSDNKAIQNTRRGGKIFAVVLPMAEVYSSLQTA